MSDQDPATSVARYRSLLAYYRTNQEQIAARAEDLARLARLTRCPECVWCAVSPEDHGECDCPPHECQTQRGARLVQDDAQAKQEPIT